MKKSFKSFFQESIIDPLMPTLSKDIFQDPKSEDPKLKEDVQRFIELGIFRLAKSVPILAYTLIGSILTRRYQDDSDLDINLLVDGKASEEESLRKLAAKESGKVLPGTKHPVNFHILTDAKYYDHANDIADGVFDVERNEFIRKPTDEPFDVKKYFGAFKLTVKKLDLLVQDLKHDLLDYEYLKTASKDQVKELKELIQKELKEIEDSAEEISDYYEKIKQDRRDAFAKPVTPEEIRKYGAKNRVPENVIYKLLEKCHYLEFLDKIDDIIGDDKKVSPGEADKLVDLIKKEPVCAT